MSKKITNEEFLYKAIKVHGYKYEYPLDDYIRNRTKIKIICPIHGQFKQTPTSHLNGCNCPKCSRKYVDLPYFIENANKLHNNFYDYSLVDYMGSKKKVKIICPKHGEFLQTPNSHLRGQGCLKCYNEKRGKLFLLLLDDLILRLNIIHDNFYDYSLVEYKGNKSKIKIICPIHGIFKQTPNGHLCGQGCPKCRGLNKTTEEYIKEVNIIHNNFYDYSLVNYKNVKTKITIICPKHGKFRQLAGNHLQGQNCPYCKQSKNERKIMNYLRNKNIFTLQEHRFLDCKYKYTLRFDFYLPEHNICIEFDGEQHFISKEFFGGDEKLKYLQNNDRIKNEYCKNNDINLIRIRYDENIIEKLNEIDFNIK